MQRSRPPVGIELIHMLHKGQMDARVGHGLTAAEQFYSLATESPSRQRSLTLKCLHTQKFATKPDQVPRLLCR